MIFQTPQIWNTNPELKHNEPPVFLMQMSLKEETFQCVYQQLMSSTKPKAHRRHGSLLTEPLQYNLLLVIRVELKGTDVAN